MTFETPPDSPCQDSLCPVDTWNAFVDGASDRLDAAFMEEGGVASTALKHIDVLNQMRARVDLTDEMRDGIDEMLKTLHSGIRRVLDITDEGRTLRFDMSKVRRACFEGTYISETENGCRRLCGSLAINESERQDYSLPTA